MILLIVFLIILLAAVTSGLYFYRAGLVVVPEGKVGLVRLRYGRHHPEDRFEVRIHGSPGRQAAALRPERRYFRSPIFCHVDYAPVTVISPGTIGVVVARTGAAAPPNHMLCRRVACDSFQDGEAFLLGGGEMGRQPDVLAAGRYYINPYLFEVLTFDTIGSAARYGLTADDLREISVPEGRTGVVIALAGQPPEQDDRAVGRRVPGHDSFQLASVFLDNGGQRGAQEETLGRGGVYRINPWFARIVLIPTRDVILEWSSKPKGENNLDAALDQIIITIEGFQLHCTVSQTIRIPARSAPLLVGRFGEQEKDWFGVSAAGNVAPVQRFVERVLGATVEGYLVATAADYDILGFLRAVGEVRLNLERRVRQALDYWGVDAVSTTLGQFTVKNPELDELQRGTATARESETRLTYERRLAEIQAEIDRINIGVDVARREGEVAGQVKLLEDQVRLLGRDAKALELFLAQLAQMNVPEVVGADASAILQYMPAAVMENLIHRVRSSLPPGSPAREADTGASKE